MWPTKKEQHAYMKKRQNQNKVNSKKNKYENWFAEKLGDLKYKRQSQWGYRIFDFWFFKQGIAVEIDGPNHNLEKDRIKDDKNYTTSGIIVLRVRNGNEEEAEEAIGFIKEAITWNERRKQLGLKPIRGNK